MRHSAAEQTIRTLIQERFPTVPPRAQHALARWVLGAMLAGDANGLSVIAALVTAGVAGHATLDEQWDTWVHQAPSKPPDHSWRVRLMSL